MPAIPNSEPQSFTAGETVEWSKSLADYPASSYTLKYAFQASGKTTITVQADADGDSYAIAIAPATSGNYAPGVYIWTAYVEGAGGSPRRVIGRGTISILPSPLAALATSHAARMLVLIEAALEGRIPNGLESTEIDGQRIDRIPVVDLRRIRADYRAELKIEEDAARVAAGIRAKPRTIGINFTNA